MQKNNRQIIVMSCYTDSCDEVKLICITPPHETSLRRSGIARIVTG